jgi:hypothetical protein
LVVLLGGTPDDNPLTLSKASLVEVDEDMTPSDITFDYKVSSFLCLYNDKTKNLLPPNISILNVLRNSCDDNRVWICHEYDQSWSASSSKSNIWFIGSPTGHLGKAITHSSGV